MAAVSLDLPDYESVWDDIDDILAMFVPAGLPASLIHPVREALRHRLGRGVRDAGRELAQELSDHSAAKAYDIVRKHLTA